MAATPELVAPGVYRVDAIRLPSAINVLLLEDDDGWTLVDTGIPNSAEGCIVSGVAFLAAIESTVELFVDDGRGGRASASSQLGPCANSP